MADIRLTYGRSTADIRRTYGGYMADIRLTYLPKLYCDRKFCECRLRSWTRTTGLAPLHIPSRHTSEILKSITTVHRLIMYYDLTCVIQMILVLDAYQYYSTQASPY